MMDRHLYDTMPNAWKELGNAVIPLPIPKPYAAGAATLSRRHSIASQSSMATNAGPISARRVDTRVTGPNPNNAEQSKRVINRRQSIQVDILKRLTSIGTTIVSSKSGKNWSTFGFQRVNSSDSFFPHCPFQEHVHVPRQMCPTNVNVAMTPVTSAAKIQRAAVQHSRASYKNLKMMHCSKYRQSQRKFANREQMLLQRTLIQS